MDKKCSQSCQKGLWFGQEPVKVGTKCICLGQNTVKVGTKSIWLGQNTVKVVRTSVVCTKMQSWQYCPWFGQLVCERRFNKSTTFGQNWDIYMKGQNPPNHQYQTCDLNSKTMESDSNDIDNDQIDLHCSKLISGLHKFMYTYMSPSQHQPNILNHVRFQGQIAVTYLFITFNWNHSTCFRFCSDTIK